jgi:hypothetical protein
MTLEAFNVDVEVQECSPAEAEWRIVGKVRGAMLDNRRPVDYP